MSSSHLMNPYDAASALLKYVYSGVLGSTKGMGVSYALMRTTDNAFTYSTALEPVSGPPGPVERYQIEVDRRDGKMSEPKLIRITDEDMQKAIFAATGETLLSSCRYTDGGLSISYRVTTVQKPDSGYVVQLRHHGNVASMNAFMKFVQENTSRGAVPMPAIYPIPGEAEHQRETGFGRQIAQMIPGVTAEGVYSQISHPERLEIVRKMAGAWQACWDLPLPSPRRIGELVATDKDGEISLAVGPDRHFSLGGPFLSVRDWLKERLRHTVSSLERATGIDDYKAEYLTPIKRFVDTRLDQIPDTVEDCPVVALHVDMGLHNVLVSAEEPTQINAIIDWEFCASAPYLAAYECIDKLFRMGSENGFGTEYPHAQDLREAFWNEIPKWKAHWESQASRDFMLWFRFALFLRPSYCSSQLPLIEKKKFWAENIRIVEEMLAMHGIKES